MSDIISKVEKDCDRNVDVESEEVEVDGEEGEDVIVEK